MQISKWGKSLAARLPAAVVEALELKAGDNIDIDVRGDNSFADERSTDGGNVALLEPTV
jgi:antitoxin MazE